jgi:chromosome segregation ATPase
MVKTTGGGRRLPLLSIEDDKDVSPPSSPTTITKILPDGAASSSPTSNGTGLLSAYHSLKSKKSGGDRRVVSWHDARQEVEIPVTNYLEKMEAENAKLKARADTIYKEMGALVVERDALEREKEDLEAQNKRLEETIQQNSKAQDIVLEKTSRQIIELEIRIEELQAEVASLKKQLVSPQRQAASPTKEQTTAEIVLKDEIKQLKQKLESATAMVKQMSEQKGASVSAQKELELKTTNIAK